MPPVYDVLSILGRRLSWPCMCDAGSR